MVKETKIEFEGVLQYVGPITDSHFYSYETQIIQTGSFIIQQE